MPASDELRIIISATDEASAILNKTQKGLDGVGDSARKSGGGLKALNDAFSELTGVSLTGMGAIAAAGMAYKAIMTEAFNAERQMAATEAVIRSTGGAAGMTAEEVIALSEEMMQITGIGHDVVGAGENMLLTFKSIGQETFPRATKAMVDMAIAMSNGNMANIDFKSTAIQLGKALQEPIEGVTALRRVGVQLSDVQEQQIKQFMAVNDIASAQAIVLAEVESEFGGMAEAMGGTNLGKIERAKASLGELAEGIGLKLIPVLGDAAEASNNLVGLVFTLGDVYQKHNADMAKTAKTYQEYTTEMSRAAVAADPVLAALKELGLLNGAFGASLIGVGTAQNVAARGAQIMTEEQWNQARATATATKAQYEQRRVIEQLAAEQEKLAKIQPEAEKAIAEAAAKRKKDLADFAQKTRESNIALDTDLANLAEKHVEREADRYRELAKLRDDYNDQTTESARELTQKLGDLSASHLEKEQSIKDQLTALDEDYTVKKEENARQLNERLAELADRNIERQRKAQEQLGDLLGDYEDDRQGRQERTQETIAGIEEKYNGKRKEVWRSLQGAYHGGEKYRIDAAIALLNQQEQEEKTKIEAKATKEEARYKAEHDKRLMRLQEQIAHENAEYDKQVEKLKADAERKAAEEKADHEKKLAELQTQLAKEDAEYAKQTERMRAEAELRRAADQKTHDERLAGLRFELTQEDVEYAKQTDKTRAEYNKRLEDYRAHMNEVKAAYNTAIDEMKAKWVESGLSEWAIAALMANADVARAASNLGGGMVEHPANVPGYQAGGIVPGPAGRAQLVVVHGGETITPAGGGSTGNFTFIYSPQISLADEREVEARLVPVLDRWYQDARRRRVVG